MNGGVIVKTDTVAMSVARGIIAEEESKRAVVATRGQRSWETRAARRRGEVAPGSAGQDVSRQLGASTAGLTRYQYLRASAVVRAAWDDPGRFADLLPVLDRDGGVWEAWTEMMRRRGDLPRDKEPQGDPVREHRLAQRHAVHRRQPMAVADEEMRRALVVLGGACMGLGGLDVGALSADGLRAHAGELASIMASLTRLRRDLKRRIECEQQQ